jgi:hypothetical protein
MTISPQAGIWLTQVNAGRAVRVHVLVNHLSALLTGIRHMRLFFLLCSLVATVLSGVGIVAVLVMALPGWEPLVAAIAGGALAAIPATWAAARTIAKL